VSGAVQHIVGIRNAKKVIAVNKDPQAAIFRYADEGIVADWREIFTDEYCQ
jgi:electron transfer flavoprotein alpha subunit